MIQHEVSLHLNCPVDQVFAFLVDSKNLHLWQSNLIENEQMTQGPIHVGTLFREVRRTGPRQSEIKAEVTVYDEVNKQFETKTITKPQATVNYSLERETSGTHLNYKFVMHTTGIMRLLEPLIASSMKKDTEMDFQKLKSVLESK
jgi:Polyketide cyclase / dehydrase and lipid transport